MLVQRVSFRSLPALFSWLFGSPMCVCCRWLMSYLLAFKCILESMCLKEALVPAFHSYFTICVLSLTYLSDKDISDIIKKVTASAFFDKGANSGKIEEEASGPESKGETAVSRISPELRSQSPVDTASGDHSPDEEEADDNAYHVSRCGNNFFQ